MVDQPFLSNLKYAYKTRDKLCLVQEFYQGGDLFTDFKNDSRAQYTEGEARFYVAEVILAIEQLHKVSQLLIT